MDSIFQLTFLKRITKTKSNSDIKTLIHTVQLNEGYQLNTILPFVVFMIRDFDFSEESVGLYAGLLTATFALCQFLSSYFWGWISDVYGRRIALLLGVSVSCIAIIIFGLSKSYAQAISARAIAGIFNGNIGVARAYIADITDSKNRSFAFSIFAIAFSGGIILGSAAGGGLIHSYELEEDGTHRPSESVLPFWIFQYDYPYLPPCILGACISLFAFILIAIYITDIKKGKSFQQTAESTSNYTDFVDNTLKETVESQSRSLPLMSMDGVSAKRSTMRDNNSIYNRDDMSIPISDKQNKSMTLNNMDELIETSLVDGNVYGTATSALHDVLKSFHTFEPEKRKLLDTNNETLDENKESLMENWKSIKTLPQLFRYTNLAHALVINSTMMLMLVTWNAMVPLLMAQTLEFDSTEIGIQMAFCGIVLFIFTWYIQPPIMKKYNYKFLYVMFGSIMVIVIILFPSIAVIPNINNLNKWLLLVIVSVIGSFKFAAATNLVVTSFCFINNSVPKHTLGRANGLGQALGSGLRGLGPLVGGSLWSWSMTLNSQFAVYIAYAFMAIFTAASVIHCWIFIEYDIQIVFEERMKRKQSKQTQT